MIPPSTLYYDGGIALLLVVVGFIVGIIRGGFAFDDVHSLVQE